MNDYTKNDFKVFANIMDKIDKDKGRNKLNATTIKEIIDKTKISMSAVRISIKKLLDDGFIDYGISNGRNKTYHVTKKGLDKFYEMSTNIYSDNEEEFENEQE